MGWTETQTWAGLNRKMCVHLTRKTVKRQWHKQTTKKRDCENEGSSMHDGTCIGINYAHRFPSVSGHFTHCWAFRSVLRVVNSICRCTTLFNFWPVREFLKEIHTAKTVLWGVVFTLRDFWCSRGNQVRNPFAASRDRIHHRLDFAVTLSSPASFCVLFDITSEPSVELEG